MCGRYTLIADLRRPGPKRFEFDGSDFSYDPGYNIAPTESVLTRQERGRSRGGVHEAGGLYPSGPRTQKSGPG